VNKQATRPDEATADGAEADFKKRAPVAIDLRRVRNLAHITGEPRQVVLENHLDPVEVLRDTAYWVALPHNILPVGSKFELTNDAGSYLFEVWVRSMFATASTGVRDARFFHRVVWDERDGTIVQPFVPTGRWEVRFDGRHHQWRVYRPNGAVVGTSFNDENSARVYMRQQEGNPQTR
jgi:hypothetical protein